MSVGAVNNNNGCSVEQNARARECTGKRTASAQQQGLTAQACRAYRSRVAKCLGTAAKQILQGALRLKRKLNVPRMPPAQRDQRPIHNQHTGRQQRSSHVHPPPGPAKAHAARRSAAQHPQSATQPVARIWRWLAQPDSSNMGTLCTQPRPLAQPGTLKHTQDHATAPQNEQQQAGSTHKQPLQLTCPAAPRRTAADRPERR